MIKEYGYEYDAVLNEEIWENTEGKVTNQMLMNALCLRSGRDALKAVAREYEPCVALLPSLACDSMIHPFELYGHEIQYYKLNDDFSIDIDSLKIYDQKYLLLYNDYFGNRASNDYVFEELRKKANIIFIEDRTHNLIWERKYLFQPDYIIASLRKWIPVPDGGLLWGGIKKTLGKDTVFSSTRLKAQCMRHEYFISGDERIKSEYRKIFSSVSELMDDDAPSAMSAYSYALAKETNWEEVRNIRRKNAEVLINKLSYSSHIHFIQKNTGQSDLYVAFIVPNRDEVQRRLSSKGIFNTIIWPLNEEQKKVCSFSKNIEENMLAAPCDQRYSIVDMEIIGEEIVRIIEDVNR